MNDNIFEMIERFNHICAFLLGICIAKGIIFFINKLLLKFPQKAFLQKKIIISLITFILLISIILLYSYITTTYLAFLRNNWKELLAMVLVWYIVQLIFIQKKE